MESIEFSWVTNVRDLAKKFLMPLEGSEDMKNPRLVADAIGAVEVVVSICNMFRALITSSSGRQSLWDLTFLLNSNPFWVQNRTFFMPLLIAAQNANMDYVQGNTEPLWDKLYYHNKQVWLELLPMVVYQLHGPAKMQLVSLEMKKSFEAFVK